MFNTRVVNVFIPLGNEQSPQDILAGISSYCVNPEIPGELLIRVFEYRNISKVLKITKNKDTVLTYPDVFPLGRHYNQTEYAELIKKTVENAYGVVADRSIPKDFKSLDGSVRLIHLAPRFDVFLNNNLSWYFKYSSNNLTSVDPKIAKHVGSKPVAFVAAEPVITQPTVDPTPVKNDGLPAKNEAEPVPTPVSEPGNGGVPTDSPKTPLCCNCNHITG